MFLQDERGYNQVFPKRGTSILRARRRADWIAAQLTAGGVRHAIEIGCGTGEMAFQVAQTTNAHVLAVDLSEKFVAEARQRFNLPNLEYRVLDVLSEDLPGLTHTDAVFGNGVLHHLIPQLPQVLRRLLNLVHDGGTLAFIEPNLRHPICRFLFETRLGRKLGHLEPQEMAFRAEELQAVVGGAGWRNVEIMTGDFLLPGLPRAATGPSLWMERRLQQNPLASSLLGQSHFLSARA
jgi:SAM-dependent methyltransferase